MTPAVPDHPFFRTSRFLRLEGFQTHVQEFPAPSSRDDSRGVTSSQDDAQGLARSSPIDARGAGEPVILVNGGMASTFQWRAIVPALAARHRVIAYDWPGQGLSERPRERRYYDPAFLARHLRALAEALDAPVARLVAGSIGAAIALRYARLFPEAVAKLVLVAGVGFPQRLQRQVAAFKSASFVRLTLLPGLRRLYSSQRLARRWMRSLCERLPSDEDVALYTRILMSEGPAGYAWPYHHVLHAFQLEKPSPIEAEYARIECPVLLLSGDRDRYVPIEHGHRFAEALPHARLHVIKGSGHWPPDEAPDETAAVLLDFFAHAGKLSAPTRSSSSGCA